MLTLTDRVRHYFTGSDPVIRYTMDGLLFATAMYIASNNHNLFALRLGAGEYQLSLVLFLPQMLNMLIVIPGGIFTGSLKNKRRMIKGALIAAAFAFFLCSFSAYFNSYSIYFFLAFISLASGSMVLYNISWQSYFPDVVDVNARNYVFTRRMHMDVFISIPVPLLVGFLLTRTAAASGKIAIHQGFYISAAVFLVLTAFNFQKIEAIRPAIQKHISFDEFKKAIKILGQNRQYVLFLAVAIFFYMTWHLDWTLYFIGQVSYLKMNEFQVMLTSLGSTATQFITMKFWSKKNEKYGVVLPLVFGILGLSLNPVSMIAVLNMPASYAPYVFLILHAIVSLPLATVTLNMYQSLLQVTEEEYRSFSLSVFACLMCLSNAIMPVAGVALYRAFGGDKNGLCYTFAIAFFLRIAAAIFWMLRWKQFKPVLASHPQI